MIDFFDIYYALLNSDPGFKRIHIRYTTYLNSTEFYIKTLIENIESIHNDTIPTEDLYRELCFVMPHLYILYKGIVAKYEF